MAKDIRIRAVLDDQASAGLSKLQGNLKGFQQNSSKAVSEVFKNSENQAQQIINKTGGAGLLGSALLGAGAGAGAGVTKALKGYTGDFKAWSLAYNQGLARATQGLKIYSKEFNDAMAKEKKNWLETKSAADNHEKSIFSTVDALKTVPVAFTAVSAAIALFLKNMDRISQRADVIDTMAQRLGVTNVRFQELQYIADRSSVSIESFQTAFRILSQQIVDAGRGVEDTKKFFEALGLSVDDLVKKDPAELFDTVIGSLRNLKSETARNAIGMKLLGRGFQDLIPLMNSNKDGMEALRKEAHDLGYVMTEEQVKRLDDVHEAFVRLGAVWKGTMQNIALENTSLTNRWLEGLQDWIKAFGNVVKWLPKAWETAVHAVALGIDAIELVFKTLGSAAGNVFIVAATGSILAGTTLFATTIGQLLPKKMQEGLQSSMEQMSKFMDNAWSGVGDTWKAGVEKLKGEWAKLEEIWAKETVVVNAKKQKTSLEELLALLKKLTKEKSKQIDMDMLWVGTFLNILNRQVAADKKVIENLEKKTALIDKQITAYERLADITARYAGLSSSFEETRIRNMQEESRLLQQVEMDYQSNLISWEEMNRAKSMVTQVYQREDQKNQLDAYNTMNDYAIGVLDSFAGFAQQLSENRLKEIDRWENREQRRIDNSILAEEYKTVEQEKLAAKAEQRRKEEFNKMKALNLAEAIVNTAAGFTKELATGGVYGIITGLLVAAAGAAEIATIAAEQYAKGGIVPGQSYTGDKVPAKVNSGEMVLTAEQQAQLFNMANGSGSGSAVSISAPINISGNADQSTITLLKNQHEKHLENIRSAIVELQYRGRISGVAVA